MLRTVLLLLLAGALLALWNEQDDGPTDANMVALAASTSAGEKLKARLGKVGARAVSPLIKSMTRDTERLLDDVTPLIAQARPQDARRARDISKRILSEDSAALRNLQQGRPLRAFQHALDGRGLIPAVRQAVAEERAFR